MSIMIIKQNKLSLLKTGGEKMQFIDRYYEQQVLEIAEVVISKIDNDIYYVVKHRYEDKAANKYIDAKDVLDYLNSVLHVALITGKHADGLTTNFNFEYK